MVFPFMGWWRLQAGYRPSFILAKNLDIFSTSFQFHLDHTGEDSRSMDLDNHSMDLLILIIVVMEIMAAVMAIMPAVIVAMPAVMASHIMDKHQCNYLSSYLNKFIHVSTT